MPKSIIWILAFLVGLMALPRVSAQFRPRATVNFNAGIYPAASFNPFLPSLPRVPGRFSTHNYTLSGVNANGPYSLNYTFYRNTAVVPAYSAPSVYSGGYYGGLSAGYSAVADGKSPIANQLRKAINQEQNRPEWDNRLRGNNPSFDALLKESATRINPEPGAAALKLTEDLLDPAPEAVTSGDVLNELAALIIEQEAKGKKAASGLCPPDLIEKVHFAGDDTALAANLFRHGELLLPDCLRGPDFLVVREDLQKTYRPLAAVVSAGRKPGAEDLDKFTRAIARSKEELAKYIKEAPTADAITVTEYIKGLSGAVSVLRDPAAVGIAGEKWHSLGVSVADLVKHLNKFKLRIAPATEANEAAYYALHRGLLTYYGGLLQAK